MRLRAFGLAFVLLLLATETSGQPAPTGVALIDEVIRLTDRYFYDPNTSDEFRAAMIEAAAGLPENASDEEVSQLIAGTLEDLGLSHTGFFTRDHPDYFELLDIFRSNYRDRVRTLFPGGRITYEGIGLATREIEGQTFVARLYDDGPAERAGLRVGDEIVSADGSSYRPRLSFEGKAGISVLLGLRRSQSAPVSFVAVRVEALQPTETLLRAIRASARVIDRGNRRLGYIRIWTFHDPEVIEIVTSALSGQELAGVDGLILDLRGRWGGAPPDAAEIFLGGTPSMRVTERDGSRSYPNFRWRGPIVALVDGGTRSGMEILAYSLKAAGVPLVGETTAGALLAGRGFLLSDGSLLEIAVLDVDLDGVRLEGVGVAPDIEVPFDIRYAGGEDPQLEAALATMAERLDAAGLTPACSVGAAVPDQEIPSELPTRGGRGRPVACADFQRQGS